MFSLPLLRTDEEFKQMFLESLLAEMDENDFQ